jgi:hypothetical protein
LVRQYVALLDGAEHTRAYELLTSFAPDEGKRVRSDKFWSGVLSTIKGIGESGT